MSHTPLELFYRDRILIITLSIKKTMVNRKNQGQLRRQIPVSMYKNQGLSSSLSIAQDHGQV